MIDSPTSASRWHHHWSTAAIAIYTAKSWGVRKLDKGYAYGVEFTDMDEKSSQSIRDFINRIIAGG